MIYLDYAASTPVDDDVLNTFIDITKTEYANPNSNHIMGIKAKEKIDEATNKIAELLNVNKSEIIYTSGATESNNLAVIGTAMRYKNRGKHILISSLEHNSIISSCAYLQENGFEIELIPINKEGLIDIEALKNMIREDTILVSICSVDSEIGLTQPIEEIGLLLKKYDNIIFHTDASQSIGKVKIDFTNCDLITIAPHKFYGMGGISILVKKDHVSITPLILGGKSTTVYRSGTPVTNLIVSTQVALERAINLLEKRNRIIEERYKTIIKHLKQYNDITINNKEKSIPHTINISISKIKSDIFVEELNKRGIMISAKTSCCPLNTPSKLVYALTKDKSLASTSIRISLSHLTTEDEIQKFLEIFDITYRELVYGEI